MSDFAKWMRPVRGWSRGSNGRTVSNSWSVIAPSVEAAVALVNIEHENLATKGTIYKDYQGSTPDPFVVCLQIDVDTVVPAPTSGTGLYHVHAHYGIPAQTYSAPEPTIDGTPRLYVEPAIQSEPVDVDVNGRPIANPLGEPFDPPLSAFTASQMIVATWLESASDYTTAYNRYKSYLLKLNSAVWKGGEIRSLLCIDIRVEDASFPATGGQPYYRFSARFHYKPPKPLPTNVYIRTGTGPLDLSQYAGLGSVDKYVGGWDDLTVIRSFHKWGIKAGTTDQKERVAIQVSDESGGLVKPSNPQWVNNQGQYIPSDTGSPYFMVIQNYKEADFNLLPI